MEKRPHILNGEDFGQLLDALRAAGYRVLGPTRRDKAIVYDELDAVCDLPVGWTDEQDGGTYRLKKQTEQSFFGYVIGPDSWKKYLYPPRQQLFTCTREGGTLSLNEPAIDETPLAFLGMRACELHAIAVQDRVFMDPRFTDPGYARRRTSAFFVAVNCTRAAKTCFCSSMNTGPRVDLPVDLNLTECIDGDQHVFVIEAGSEKGAAILSKLPTRSASEEEIQVANAKIEQASQQMGRKMNTEGLKELLYANLDHPRWEEVAERCLGCTNCTMVCPTCFCTTVEDTTDIPGSTAERTRRWDSCFSWDFSSMHGASVRKSGKSRYRQWLTHKLASWHDQFDSSGCVGCGRCISWCPVGIDLTEEVEAIRKTEHVEARHAHS